MPGSFAALAFAFVVAGLGIYSALAHSSRSASVGMRNIVFVAFPLVLLGMSLSGYARLLSRCLM